MRAEPRAAALVWIALACAAALASAAAASAAVEAPPDSARASTARADSLAPKGAARDSLGALTPFRLVRPGSPRDTSQAAPRREPLARVDLGEVRKHGDAALLEALRFTRPTPGVPLPVHGPRLGTPRLADSGTPIRIAGVWPLSDAATDRTPAAARSEGSRGLDFATVLDDPEGLGVELLDFDALSSPVEPRAFQGAGDALALFEASRATEAPSGNRPRAGFARRPRSTLTYRNGTGDALGAGVRFETPLLGRGVRASYARRSADGLPPLTRLASTRYALEAGLPSLLDHDLSIEGRHFKRSVTDDRHGEALWKERWLALHARGRSGAVADSWALRVGTSHRAQVSQLNARERWAFPGVSVEGEVSAPAGRRRTATASVRAATRRVSYRVDSLPAFDPRRGEVRGSVGFRQALSGGAGVGADAAYDARASSPGFLDARASLWLERPRINLRLDLERAHERPSWIDLLTPARAETLENPLLLPAMERIFRSGDPSLRPRRLSGALGSGALSVSRALTVGMSGAVRRLSDDFGWDLIRSATPDTLYLDARARRRGDGWVSYAAASWRLRAGPIGASGLAWMRGGPEHLSPRSGSPPRRALDASLESRVTLFQGDLPLRLMARAHARGRRRGPIAEPAAVLWDAALRADLDQAGLFFEVDNVFDRETASGFYEIEPDRGAPAPGRSIHFGIVWNLID